MSRSRATKGDGKGASAKGGNWKSTVPAAKERKVFQKSMAQATLLNGVEGPRRLFLT